MTQDFTQSTKRLIDDLKSICANYGLGNDGNEFKIITQVFLYKFMNDKFAYEAKRVDPKLANSNKWEAEVAKYSIKKYEMLLLSLCPDCAKLKREHYISSVTKRQGEGDFANYFDDTLRDIAIFNNDIFSVKTEEGAKVTLFDELSTFITGSAGKRDEFCKAIVNQLGEFSFENVFDRKYDFFATIFEYLIKDYNKDGGGKYAEYYTPHAVAEIIANVLVEKSTKNATCYDPAAGSGTLLMSLAHKIGEDKCTLYSQDISQKSSSMLRLNLILNNLVHSIQNVIQGNTLRHPYHKDNDALKTFDFIVSNPPFKLDFSDWRDDLETKVNDERFFAGIPKIKAKSKDKMEIYLLFIQHIMYSLSKKGRAAIVVPTGFITAQSGIERKIRERIVEQKMLRGVISMPSNIFATTGTNVSVLFLDKGNTEGEIVLMDASKLGTVTKEGKNQKTVLSHEEEKLIVSTFRERKAVDNFSVIVSYDDIAAKNYSMSAGQYFDVKIEYVDITAAEFAAKMKAYTDNIDALFNESHKLEKEIKKQLTGLKYE